MTQHPRKADSPDPDWKRDLIDDPVRFNQSAWDRVAGEGNAYFTAATAEQIAAARLGDWKIRVTPQKPVPRDWFGDLQRREVLCLAGGGGQQGPILAAAGAKVTVLDISEQQLGRDREIAEREALKINTIIGDMADLSCFADQSFDLIVNPCSVCYCPDVRPIWREAFRVLRPGGRLIGGWINPVYYLFDAIKMDKGELIARHKIPYRDLDLPDAEREQVLGDSRPLEYGHCLTDLLGGQMDAGFQLVAMYEDGWGMNDKLSSMIGTFMATFGIRG